MFILQFKLCIELMVEDIVLEISPFLSLLPPTENKKQTDYEVLFLIFASATQHEKIERLCFFSGRVNQQTL